MPVKTPPKLAAKPPTVLPPPNAIVIRGANTHNLQNLSCTIPHGKLTVVTGPSGSGKSSLAFHTLYAEGQRRYLESLSSYARQFLDRLEKPDVEQILNILPAVALEQKNGVKNARSTVGTTTEAYDTLRLVFAALGQTQCHTCKSTHVGPVQPDRVAQYLQQLPEKTRLWVLSPIALTQEALDKAKTDGFTRYILSGTDILELTPKTTLVELQKAVKNTTTPTVLPLLIDRLAIKPGLETQNRLVEALNQAAGLNGQNGSGQFWLKIQKPDSKELEERKLSLGFACYDCGEPHLKPVAAMFSFNHPLGACPTCEGFGRVMGIDPERIIPNKQLSLLQGAIHPFQTPANQELQALLEEEAKKAKLPLDIPYNDLTLAHRELIWQGKGAYPGIRPFFDWLETKRYKVHVRVMLARYRGYYNCADCKGSRLRPEALRVRVEGKTIGQLTALPVKDLLVWAKALQQKEGEVSIVKRPLEELVFRLTYLQEVGLGYLTLSRQMRTLSGGESQRIHLASALGTLLTETLYVLDEPTVGLHAQDTQRLLGVLHHLRDLGNTLVVVEHDPDLMAGADHILDIGPASGHEGGRLVYEGDYAGLLACNYSQTGQLLKQAAHQATQPIHPSEEPPFLDPAGWLKIVGATGNNLKNLSVSLPMGQLVGVCGVSGSGKSSLIKGTLYANYLLEQSELPAIDPLPCVGLEGLETFKEVILVDQSPPGRSLRSNPVTYVKAYDEIRALFAQSAKAQALGITVGDFSFNSAGGRCETCEGLGTVTIDMQFMADVTMTCPDCNGKRFTPAVLSIELFGKNVYDVLNMTVAEALKFFKTAPKVRNRLLVLQELGLGYLKLGQTTATLSGGEIQRLKLATFMPSATGKLAGKAVVQPSLFLFDEPTTGLHLSDIEVLVAALKRLVEVGHSVIVIEHNLAFLKACDYLLELGPEGGEGGGHLLASGFGPTFWQNPASITAQFA